MHPMSQQRSEKYENSRKSFEIHRISLILLLTLNQNLNVCCSGVGLQMTQLVVASKYTADPNINSFIIL